MRHILACIGGGLAGAMACPAAAEVTASSESGFVSHNEADVPAPPGEVWASMLRPADWWNGDHTYSGKSSNLTLDPVAGGCFCEVVPNAGAGPAGHVEHMRVVYLAPNATLRLNGGLGPLQAEAVEGVLTMTLAPSDQGTKISWDYVVGGYARVPLKELAPVVDRVIGEQLARLALVLKGAHVPLK